MCSVLMAVYPITGIIHMECEQTSGGSTGEEQENIENSSDRGFIDDSPQIQGTPHH